MVLPDKIFAVQIFQRALEANKIWKMESNLKNENISVCRITRRKRLKRSTFTISSLS